MKIGQYAFARLYGYMLGRTYRNSPEDACRDAITPFMIVVGVPALLAGVILLDLISPRLLSSKDWIPLVTIPSGIVMYLISKPLQAYAETPEIGAPFRSPKSRRVTMLCYLGVLAGSILMAAIVGRLLIRLSGNH
jgi:hypothetical protein